MPEFGQARLKVKERLVTSRDSEETCEWRGMSQMEEEKRDNFSKDRSDNARKSPSGETGTHRLHAWRVTFVTLSDVERARLWASPFGLAHPACPAQVSPTTGTFLIPF